MGLGIGLTQDDSHSGSANYARSYRPDAQYRLRPDKVQIALLSTPEGFSLGCSAGGSCPREYKWTHFRTKAGFDRPFAPRRCLGPQSNAPLGDSALDRKSTRLNSSHVAISYAVFCLKKKNKEGLADARA